jgi:hypothetical protein
MRPLVAAPVVLGMLSLVPQAAEAQCQTFSLPELVTLTGTLDSTDCTVLPQRNSTGENWTVFANTGETMVITMNRVTMADPYLFLVSPSGTVVATNDDGGTGFNSRIQYVAAATGLYRVIATSFRQLPSTDFGTYEIRYEVIGHSPCQIRNLPAGTTMNATLDSTDCIVQPYRGTRGEIWTIVATAGDRIQVDMERFTLNDPYLFLLDSGWQVLASNDDFGGTRNARISFIATYSGVYRIIATTFALADPGAYSIRYEGQVPPPTTGIPGPPGQPDAIVTGNQVNISWTPPTTGSTPILEYLLEAGNFPGGSNLGTFSLGTFTSVVASVANGTYYVRVRARNAFGTGPASPERSFTIGVFTVLQPPRNLTATVSGRRVALLWVVPTDGPPDAYRLEVGSVPGAANLLVVDLPGGPTSITFDDAPPGLYYVRLRAVRSGAVSPPSNEIVVLIL